MSESIFSWDEYVNAALSKTYPDVSNLKESLIPIVLKPKTNSFPALPYELEEHIFRLVAEGSTEAAKCATVCRDVQKWTEPALYRSILLNRPHYDALFLQTFRSRPRSFFAEHVKHLYLPLNVRTNDAIEIISACTGLVTLAYWTTRPIVDSISSKTLQKLTVSFAGLGLLPHPRSLAKLLPNVTHLEVADIPEDGHNTRYDWDSLFSLPALTHLALSRLRDRGHEYLFAIIWKFLKTHPRSLMILIEIHFYGELFETRFKDHPHVIIRDYASCNLRAFDDWESLQRGEANMWQAAKMKRRQQILRP